MRSAIIGLGICLGLAACGGPSKPVEQAPAAAAPANPEVARATLQLRARMGAEPVLSGLRHGTNEGKPVLCGQAAATGAPPQPFVMRSGYLIMPVDASPEQFAALQAYCTEDGPGG